MKAETVMSKMVKKTVRNDSESDSCDPWEKLQAQVRGALNTSYVKQVERFLDKGA